MAGIDDIRIDTAPDGYVFRFPAAEKYVCGIGVGSLPTAHPISRDEAARILGKKSGTAGAKLALKKKFMEAMETVPPASVKTEAAWVRWMIEALVGKAESRTNVQYTPDETVKL